MGHNIVKQRFDDMIYSKKEIVDKVDSLEHELVREATRITGVDKSVEITTLADVPWEGSGYRVLQDMAQLAFEAKDAVVHETFSEFRELLHRGWNLKK